MILLNVGKPRKIKKTDAVEKEPISLFSAVDNSFLIVMSICIK
jgi:hypothetical protein